VIDTGLFILDCNIPPNKLLPFTDSKFCMFIWSIIILKYYEFLRPIGKGDQELEKRLDQEELT
jgi:hypothetical protein